ncbi:ATP-binding protein [Silvibacterium sp.]|uniref:ATP-binding protein n=1 Tax=Silvibacterium sp. TaxID=1964179 RepID=UPI0039E57A21
MMATLVTRAKTQRRGLIVAAVAASAALLGLGSALLLRGPNHGLPYHDAFAASSLQGWIPFGGSWHAADGGVRNDSEERGAKLITGSAHWSSYAVEADLQLIGGGDAGLIARASDIEQGVDAYSGYYAGLRTIDNKLVLGRADHGWVEFQPQPFPGGIVPGRWYHLRLAVQGCTITARASGIDTPGSTEIRAEDPHCLTSGKIGLRSVTAGGFWRHVQVTALEPRENTPAPAQHMAVYPTSQGTIPSPSSVPSTLLSEFTPAHPAISVKSLRLLSITRTNHVTVHGVVISTTPDLYIQDRGGGARVQLERPTLLRLGDEVEVEGDAHPEGLSAAITGAVARRIGGVSPLPPSSVTADQAATGAYASMYLEVQGHLDRIEWNGERGATLLMHDGMQTFRALSVSPEAAALFRHLDQYSVIRVRGICVLGAEYTNNAVPFVLLVSSPQDVSVVDGPPWWSTEHLILMAVAMLALGFVAQLLLSRAEEWRLHAVINERERLANELHDTLAQSFAGIGFQLRAIRNRMAQKEKTLDVPSLLEDLKIATELVRHSHDEARRSITTLRPEAIEASGLVSALEMAARRIVARGQVKIDVEVRGEARELPLHVLDSLFRIGQEAISNAIQHGHPTRIHIEVEYGPRSITLIVKDNGIGFVPREDSGGFGLSGMRRRAELIHGTLEVQSGAAGGTRIRVEVPNPERQSWFVRLAYSKRNNQE